MSVVGRLGVACVVIVSLLVACLSSDPGALAPLHELGDGQAVHVGRGPVKDHGQVGHGVLYAAGESASCAFVKKKVATLVPS